MARVPSAADVAQAPPPRLIGRQVASTITGDTFGAGSLRAAAGAMEAVQDFALLERERRFDTERKAALNEIAASLPISYERVLEESKSTASEGGKGFFATTQERLAAERERVLEEVRSRYDLRDEDFETLSAQAVQLAAPTMSAALRFENSERKRFFTERLNSQVQEIALDAARDPDAASVRMAQIETAIQNAEGFLSPEDAAKLRKAATKIVSMSAIEGRIDRDPAGTLRSLRAGEYDKLVKDGHLDVDDILKLTKAAQKEHRLRVAEAEKAEKLANAQALSDLEIKVSRGEAGEDEIEAAYDEGKGWLKPNQRTELIKLADRVAGKVAKIEAAKARVQAAVEGTGTLDPREEADRDAVDAYYTETVLPSIQALPEERAGDAVEIVTNFVDKAGIIPSAIKSGIRGGLRSTDAQKRIQAADTLDRLVARNPALGQDFAQEDIALGTAIMANVRAGVEPQRAIELAETNVLKAGEPEQKKRREFFTANAKRIRDENARTLERELGGGLTGTLLGIGTPRTDTTALAGAYDRLVEQHYMVQGDIDIARKAALQELQQVWGVTEIGPRRWMPYAPERVYQVPGAPEGWHREQLLADLKAGGMFDPSKGDIEDRVVIAPTPETGRMALPAYSVLLQNENGELIPLRKPDGSLLLWRPDWASSPAAKRMEEEAEKAKSEAEKHRQRVRDTKRENLDQLQRMREGGMFGGEAAEAGMRRGESDGGQEVFSRSGGMTDEDVAAARRAGVLEGSGFEGMPQVIESEDDYIRATTMIRKSPVLALGFDPHRHRNVVNLASGGAGAGSGGVLQGQFIAEGDMVETAAETRFGGFNPTVLAHESGHRGLALLAERLKNYKPADEKEAEAIDDLHFILDDERREEAVVRLLHHRVAGTKPTQWEREHFPEIGGKHIKSMIEGIEKLAAKVVAKVRPGGRR